MRSPGRLVFAILLLALASARDARAVTAFRFSDLDLRDPHVWISLIGCRDVTDIQFGGFSINNETQTEITTDDDGDGLLDLSYLIAVDPLDATAAGGTLRFGYADCTSPVASTACAPPANSTSQVVVAYQNLAAGQCLAPVPGTVRPYAPAVTTANGPCFVSDPFDFNLSIGGGLVLALRNARVAGTWVGNPPAQIVSGLLIGFLRETDANNTILSKEYPLIGGKPVSELLPGGDPPGPGVNCAGHSDRDVSGETGWWFYLNFPATPVSYSGPVAVEPPARAAGLRLAARPNPFTRSVSLEFSLTTDSPVRIAVFDASGRRVRGLLDGNRAGGRHAIVWDGADDAGAPVEAGIYFARVEVAGQVESRRVALLR